MPPRHQESRVLEAAAPGFEGTRGDGEAHAESTSAVVIGTGLSGLAVAAELSRSGVRAVTVDGLESSSPSTATSALRVADLSSAESAEYLDVLRHLRKYAVSHGLDVRHHTVARHLALTEGPHGDAAARWGVRTDTGLLLADAVVLTRCAHNQLRRFLGELGYSLGDHLLEGLGEIGLYLVGVTGLAAPSTREVLRQAKHVGADVAARVGAGLQPA
ncbi:FAD-binding protein [Sinomonas notoginsengisoli]|uniref:FAD-binding protein n=1 Tax=Sinomonas notoginsengisoli TaxID=1457311 RepID=UPI001F1A8B2A|nr:FAD-binding protein [Sinomonas notoginsengisoli]